MKRKLALMLVVSLILSLGAFSTVSFAAEGETITIKTGAQFVEEVVSGKPNTTFIIEGTETLDDGTIGIRLTTDENGNEINHISISDFTGTVEGIEGKNNIQINKPLFASFGSADTTVKNINLKADSDGTFAAGTSEGYGALVSVINSPQEYTINKVANYCNVSSSAAYVGGIVGKITRGTLTINKCSNHGNVSANANQVAGIIGGAVTSGVVKMYSSYNVGDISGNRYTYGIAARVDVSGSEISDCFNAGSLVSNSGTAAQGVGGIAGSYVTETLTVKSCYNVGSVTTNNIGRISRIADSTKVIDGGKCYYIHDRQSGERSTIGTKKTIKDLAGGLEALGFDKEIWEYTDTTGANKYSLPQIKGNTFTTDKTTWYVEPEIVPEEDVTVAEGTLSFSSADDSTFVPTTSDTKEPITTAYSVVTGRFTLGNGLTENDIEYGMLISKTVSGEDLTAETCAKKARALKNYNGAYGILFYGNMVTGDTYYVRPYVKYNGVYTYGTATSFVFGE